MSWKVEVIADHSGNWCSNSVRFATREEAEKAARHLASVWASMSDDRVVEVDDPVNSRLRDDGVTVGIEAPSTGSTRVGPPK